MATSPPPISPFTGLAPQRKDKTTFSDRFDAFITWIIAFVSQMAALSLNIYNNALEAFQSAATATSAAAAAMATANVVPWVSGTTYQQYANVISPADGFTYRRRTAAGSGTTDPSLDPTNYGFVQPRGFTNMVVMRSTQQWTPPAGVTRGEISVIDGGAAGGAGDFLNNGYGGRASVSIRALNPSTTYTATVGAGGVAQQNGGGTTPGASSFAGTGLATLTSSNGDLVVDGGRWGDSLYARTTIAVAAGGANSAPGQGGSGGSGSIGYSGASGAVIIRY